MRSRRCGPGARLPPACNALRRARPAWQREERRAAALSSGAPLQLRLMQAASTALAFACTSSAEHPWPSTYLPACCQGGTRTARLFNTDAARKRVPTGRPRGAGAALAAAGRRTPAEAERRHALAQALALKIKALDDATSAAVDQLKGAQLRFAMLVRPRPQQHRGQGARRCADTGLCRPQRHPYPCPPGR